MVVQVQVLFPVQRKEKIVDVKIYYLFLLLYLINDMSKISEEDKELVKDIKQLLKTSEITQRELYQEITNKASDVAEKLVVQLIELIRDNSKEIRLKLMPNIVLNYVDGIVITRLLPSSAAVLMDNTFTVKRLFPSSSLAELFEAKKHELYSVEFRKKLCEVTGKYILARLKELGFNAKMKDRCDTYENKEVEYQVYIDE